MSRIGSKPIPIPDGVKVSLSGRTVTVEGPLGKLSWTHRDEVSAKVDDAARSVVVTRKGEERVHRSLHGLTRSLISNMVEGCSKGFSKGLELYGVGFGVQLQGKKFLVNCGYSHPVVFEVPPGITVDVTTPQARGDNEPSRFVIKGADKQQVGEFAAEIRHARKPEPYKGKGIRYAGEYVRRKVGKAFAGASGT
ncbi:MAG TPA: 50S ribosomal protein L6 [Phycisphaerae bacterium]|nr:50S ribosomal protein L6 [Phycisphaerae bacterium]